MTQAAIGVSIKALRSIEIEDFERARWNAEIAEIEKIAWRHKMPGDDAKINVLAILDARGPKTALRALGAAGAQGHWLARRIAVDIAWLAVVPLHQTETGSRCEQSLHTIVQTIDAGGDIASHIEHAQALRQLAECYIDRYAKGPESCALQAVASIVFPYESPPDDLGPVGDLCALEVLDCAIAARIECEPRRQAAARLADLGAAAEKRWQKGTSLAFEFCTGEISQAMTDLDNALQREIEPQVLAKTAAIIARRLGRKI